MAFIFTLRSEPPTSPTGQTSPAAPTKPRSVHTRNGSNADQQRLGVIMENGDAPTSPTTTIGSHRHSRRFHLGSPPLIGHDTPPPPYSIYGAVVGPKGEKLNELRENPYISARGGLRRMCIVLFIATLIAIALGVGLGVGLQKKHQTNATQQAPPPPKPSAIATGPFPAGTYSITAFLNSISTNCTSNPNTWRCAPYTTYDESSSGSAATFDWIIQTSSDSASGFKISSTENVFSLSFSDVDLTLLDSGLETERYQFRLPMNKIVVPNIDITDDNTVSMCYFNKTAFQADLYTKKAKTNPAQSSASSSAAPTTAGASGDIAFKDWPHAIEVQQLKMGGENVPACYKTPNGVMGERITKGFETQSSTSSCDCLYRNFVDGA